MKDWKDATDGGENEDELCDRSPINIRIQLPAGQLITGMGVINLCVDISTSVWSNMLQNDAFRFVDQLSLGRKQIM